MGSEGYGIASGIKGFIDTYRGMDEAQKEHELKKRALDIEEEKNKGSAEDKALSRRKTELEMKKLNQEIGQGAMNGPKLNEGQAKALANYQTLQSGEQELERLNQAGYDPTKPNLGGGLLKSAQSIAETYAPGIVPEALKSGDRKKFEAAQRMITEGILRQKSGAVIGEREEVGGNKTYTPQPGDSPEVLAEKAINRKREMESMALATGGGAGRLNQGIQGPPPGSQARQQMMQGQGSPQGASPNPAATAQDNQAIQWAKANPRDPRAAKILQMHGGG